MEDDKVSAPTWRMRTYRKKKSGQLEEMDAQVRQLTQQLESAAVVNAELKSKERALATAMRVTQRQLEGAGGAGSGAPLLPDELAAELEPQAVATIVDAISGGSGSPGGGELASSAPDGSDAAEARLRANVAAVHRAGCLSPLQLALLLELHPQWPPPGSLVEDILRRVDPAALTTFDQLMGQHMADMLRLTSLYHRSGVSPSAAAECDELACTCAARLLSGLFVTDTSVAMTRAIVGHNLDLEQHTREVAELLMNELSPEQVESILNASKACDECTERTASALHAMAAGTEATAAGASDGGAAAGADQPGAFGDGDPSTSMEATLQRAAATGLHRNRAEAAVLLLACHVISVMKSRQMAYWLIVSQPVGPAVTRTARAMRNISRASRAAHEARLQHARE